MIAGFSSFLDNAAGVSCCSAEFTAFPGCRSVSTGALAPPIGHVRDTKGRAFLTANPSWSAPFSRMAHRYPA